MQHNYPNGGIIRGWYEDENVEAPDRQVYEAKIFKKIKSLFRRKTLSNSQQTKPDYFTFEPLNSTSEGA